MSSFIGPICSIIWKDLLIELRSKETVVPTLVFVLLVVVIFNFAIDPTPTSSDLVAPGALWISFTFAGIIGINRAATLENEQNGLYGLMLCPVKRDVLYFGKSIGSFLFLLIVEATMLPIFSIMFNLPIIIPRIWLVVVLATVGFTAIGTTFSVMTANHNGRDTMLPILFFPIIVPVIIAAVQATGGVITGDPHADYYRWVGLIVAFDTIFLVLGGMTFGSLLGD